MLTCSPEFLSSSLSVMKRHFDSSTVHRQFEAADEVLSLLPICGSALPANLSGLYDITERHSDTDFQTFAMLRK